MPATPRCRSDLPAPPVTGPRDNGDQGSSIDIRVNRSQSLHNLDIRAELGHASSASSCAFLHLIGSFSSRAPSVSTERKLTDAGGTLDGEIDVDLRDIWVMRSESVANRDLHLGASHSQLRYRSVPTHRQLGTLGATHAHVAKHR